MTAELPLESTVLDDPRVDHRFLSNHRFDRAAFLRAQARIARGDLCPQTSVITAAIEPATGLTRMAEGGPEAATLRTLGETALRAGEVAVLVLNGGMATRFGGVVKGVVEVFDDRTFLALKAEDIRRARRTFGAPLPLVLMNSFNTHEASMAHVVSHDRFGLGREGLLAFEQSISLRLNRDGSLFITNDNRPSYHTPGHGDLFGSLRRSGMLHRLIDRGLHYLLVSNVDNLGATVDPVVLGHHIASRCAMTVEVTEKRRTASGNWDRGGAPAKVDGRVQIVEGFRFPPQFAQETLPTFSTNNMVFTTAALERDIPLPHHMVRKTVDDRPAFQLESIASEASGVYADGRPILPLLLLLVPRDAEASGRFYPMKEPRDLTQNRDRIRRRLEAGWAARDGRAST